MRTKLEALVPGAALVVVGTLLLTRVVVGDAHGGDFTWRMQAILRASQTPVGLIAVGSAMAAFLCARLQGRGRHRRFWYLGAACLAAAVLVGGLASRPLNAAILAWNPNAPPRDWETVRDSQLFWHWVRGTLTVAGAGVLLAAIFSAPNEAKADGAKSDPR